MTAIEEPLTLGGAPPGAAWDTDTQPGPDDAADPPAAAAATARPPGPGRSRLGGAAPARPHPAGPVVSLAQPSDGTLEPAGLPPAGQPAGAGELSARGLAAGRHRAADGGPPTAGWPGWVYRRTGRLLTPNAAERRERLLLARARLPLGRPWQVTVANPKGGSGKTTLTVGLAAALGRARGGGVLAWDNNETRGTLGLRVPAAGHDRTVRDLYADRDRFSGPSQRADLTAYTRHHGDAQLDALVSDDDPDPLGGIFDGPAFGDVRDLVARHWDVLVVDTGNNCRAANFLAAVATTDVLVVPAALRWDSVYSAAWLLDQLTAAGRADLVAGAVTVLSATPGRGPDDAALMRAHFTARTAAVHTTGYDPALDGGAELVWDACSAATRTGWLAVAADVIDPPTPTHNP